MTRCPVCMKKIERRRITGPLNERGGELEYFEHARFPDGPPEDLQLYWPGIVRDTAEPMKFEEIINPSRTDHWLVVHTH